MMADIDHAYYAPVSYTHLDVYKRQNYHYTLSFDHQGMEIGRITSQRSDFDPRLPQSNIAPAE